MQSRDDVGARGSGQIDVQWVHVAVVTTSNIHIRAHQRVLYALMCEDDALRQVLNLHKQTELHTMIS